MDLQAVNDLCRVLGDPTRVRMLAVLAHESLSVAELTQVTGLAQSRVSTHLARLKEVGLVEMRREGTASYYSAVERDPGSNAERVWKVVADNLEDPLLETDQRRAAALVEARNSDGSWSGSIAGQMERYYSPGRTWESSARAFLGLAQLGDVLDVASGDGALAELIAPRCRSLTCLDLSAKVVGAGMQRLARFEHATFVEGDMHDVPFEAGSFDQVLLLNALAHAKDPSAVIEEAARVLRPGGTLVGATLASHPHAQVVQPYGHAQLGIAPQLLRELCEASGLSVDLCEVTHTERRTPHFEVITLHARRPEGGARSEPS